MRTVANATIALEFDTTPQKYILGVTDEQYDTIVSDKFRQYVGALIAATFNPETGENPVFGQLAQGSLQPHVEKMRMTATQFAAATGLTVTDVGVINDANPTSSDAILAQSQTLVLMAQQLNTGNGDALRTIARMAQAIARKVTLDELTEEERDVMAHFRNPAMPSVAVTADAAIKIASARQEFAASVPETFVQVGMQVVAGVLVTVEQLERFVVDDELLQETVAVRRFVVSVCQVADGHAFAAVFRSHPVGVGQVDADGRADRGRLRGWPP